MAALLYKWFFVSLLIFIAPAKATVAKENLHPFYIAVTEVNHNAKDKTLEISIKVFADDLEKTLEQNYKQPVDLTNEKQKSTLDKVIPDYIIRHLAIASDGKPQHLTYVGFEKDKESAYCYFQVDNVSTVKKLDITNSILHDFNNTQINIIHAIVNGKRQSTKLDFPNKQASFSW